MIAPPDTLAFYEQRALTKRRSMANVPCAHIAPTILKYIQEAGDVRPEHSAVWFYFMNHGMSEIAKKYDKLEPLPADVREFVGHYYTKGAQEAFRAFAYLLLICVRESRHLKTAYKEEIKNGIIKASSQATYDYLGTIPDDAGQAQKLFATNPPKDNVVSFVKGLSYQFYHGQYAHSYGGKKWGVIADCLLAFVKGDTSAEVMLDTVFTLNHNTAPIFNKGFLYHEQNATSLLRVLDIQRSGQMPQAVCHDKYIANYVPGLAARAAWLHDKFGVDVGSVDWKKVVALGAVGTYINELQPPSPKPPPVVKKPPTLASPPKPMPKSSGAVLPKVKQAEVFYITPHIKIKKFKPERLKEAA